LFQTRTKDWQGAEKSLLQAAQKDPEARRLSGNEAYGSFSSLNGTAQSSGLQADFILHNDF
jgi:hypothetical protein